VTKVEQKDNRGLYALVCLIGIKATLKRWRHLGVTSLPCRFFGGRHSLRSARASCSNSTISWLVYYWNCVETHHIYGICLFLITESRRIEAKMIVHSYSLLRYSFLKALPVPMTIPRQQRVGNSNTMSTCQWQLPVPCPCPVLHVFQQSIMHSNTIALPTRSTVPKLICRSFAIATAASRRCQVKFPSLWALAAS
jgi:hypothetical protein